MSRPSLTPPPVLPADLRWTVRPSDIGRGIAYAVAPNGDIWRRADNGGQPRYYHHAPPGFRFAPALDDRPPMSRWREGRTGDAPADQP